MPNRPSPLPAALHGRVFTPSEAADVGVGPDRLRSRSVRQVTWGAHRAADDVPGTWAGLGLAGPVADLAPEEVAAVVRLTGGVASHVTAMRLHGLVVPPWLRGDGRIHVSRPHEKGRLRRSGVVSHARRVPPEDVVVVHGVRATGPERAWADLCTLLRSGQEVHAVIAGDALVRHPWVGGRREPPRSTVLGLRAALDRAGRFKGVRTARAALALIRVGADSPPETELRLALVEAGLPEPRLQAQLVTPAGENADADLAVDAARCVLHYDGAHHRTPEQQARDARRDRLWQEAGMLSLTVTAADRAEGFATVVRTVRGRLRRG